MSADDPIRRCHCGQWFRGGASSCSGETRVAPPPEEARLAHCLKMAEYYRGDLGRRWLRAAIFAGVQLAGKEGP